MLLKPLLFCFVFLLAITGTVSAQDDFCEAVTAILRDAPNQFRNVRTNVIQTSHASKIFKSGITVPGTISSRFVASMGNFYEGALAQSKTVAGIKDAYDNYKKQLSVCLDPQGLTISYGDNFYPGLEEYKKVVYMPPFNKDTSIKSLKGHVTMEVDYNKNSGLYTLLFYIYEH